MPAILDSLRYASKNVIAGQIRLNCYEWHESRKRFKDPAPLKNQAKSKK